jgi:adenine-specific DNA-methyltransferase
MLRLATSAQDEESEVVLDFFAGSGTTGHAVLELNKQDGGIRKFILVQLPEPTGRTDFPTIAEIAKERVRRVIKKLEEDSGNLDLEGKTKQKRGFRVFKLAESNFTPWDTEQDILFELLLKSGFPLTTSVQELTLADKKVYTVAGGALLICLERELTLALIRAMADQKPERVVCLDDGFAGNDQLKANAVHIFKTKGVTSFKTV